VPGRDGVRPAGLALLDRLAQHPNLPPEQNRQEDKEAFLRQAGQAEVPLYIGDRLHDPVFPYVVQAGTLIPAVLLTGINADLPGMISAQVREPVYDSVSGESLLIPQGTRLLGQYDSKIVYGQRRVLVAWQRLILPNGASIRLEGMPGIDLAGFAGLTDQVNNHWGRIFGSVLLSTVLSVGARLPAGMISRDRGTAPGEEFAVDASANINAAGQEIVRKNLNI
jgi:type IV secretion system protein VirB10